MEALDDCFTPHTRDEGEKKAAISQSKAYLWGIGAVGCGHGTAKSLGDKVPGTFDPYS